MSFTKDLVSLKPLNYEEEHV